MIELFDNKLFVLFDGIVVMVVFIKYVIGFCLVFGIELFVYIGLDMVILDGIFFVLKVKEGDIVKKGEVFVEFDKVFIE